MYVCMYVCMYVLVCFITDNIAQDTGYTLQRYEEYTLKLKHQHLTLRLNNCSNPLTSNIVTSNNT